MFFLTKYSIRADIRIKIIKPIWGNQFTNLKVSLFWWLAPQLQNDSPFPNNNISCSCLTLLNLLKYKSDYDFVKNQYFLPYSDKNCISVIEIKSNNVFGKSSIHSNFSRFHDTFYYNTDSEDIYLEIPEWEKQ